MPHLTRKLDRKDIDVLDRGEMREKLGSLRRQRCDDVAFIEYQGRDHSGDFRVEGGGE